MAHRVTVQPLSEPFTTDYVKTWLKVSVTADDTIISGLIKAARVWAEQETNLCLFTQTIEEVWDSWPGCKKIELTAWPVQSVSSVSYFVNGSYTPWSATNYTVDIVNQPARIVSKSGSPFPSLDIDIPNRVKATYVCGWSSVDDIPQSIKAAMLLKIAFLYENREDIPLGGNNPRLRSANALLQPYRILL